MSKRLPICLVFLLALTACDSALDKAVSTSEFVSAMQLEMSSSSPAPLAGHFSAQTSVPARVLVELSDGNGHDLSIGFGELTTRHENPLLGMRPGRRYTAAVRVLNVNDVEIFAFDNLELRTPPLPKDFPPIEILASDPQEMEPGFTMFTVIARKKGDNDIGGSYLVIVDSAGEVVWYVPGKFSSVFRRSNGRLLAVLSDPNSIVELDMYGDRLRSWFASESDSGSTEGIPVETRDFHHDVVPVGDEDRFLTLVRDIRKVADYPIDETDSSKTDSVPVRDEPVLEFAADGSVIRRWSLLDILKPTRIGFDGARGLPEDADWAHANSVWFDQADDSMLVSLRHQDAVVKISRRTGELIWILGSPANWSGFEDFLLSPSGSDFKWQYHQHSPKITPQGTMLLFDNGNHKASPFTEEIPTPAESNQSRAVEYAIDNENMTVSQVWQWSGSRIGEQLYSPIVGDADYLGTTGNVLISYAGLCHEDGVPSDDAKACRLSIRIIEVDRDQPDRPVFDLHIADPSGAISWVSYRSERIRSLYPRGVVD
jgi:hypothetical protein